MKSWLNVQLQACTSTWNTVKLEDRSSMTCLKPAMMQNGHDVEYRCFDVLKQMYTVQTKSPCRLACCFPLVRSPERALGCHLCILFSSRVNYHPMLRTTLLWHIQGESAGPEYLPTSVLDSEARSYPVSLPHLGVP